MSRKSPLTIFESYFVDKLCSVNCFDFYIEIKEQLFAEWLGWDEVK